MILCPSKNDLQTVLIDCGIVGPGALAYAAPERFQGKPASVKSDLFSIGLMLFRWVAGRDLLRAEDFDGYAAQGAAIDNVDVTGILYEMGCFSAQELSALDPLWKSLLRSNQEDRSEDFDELDELLEIALSTLGVGEVTAQTALQKFSESLLEEKMGRKFPASALNGEKTPIPYRKRDQQPQKKNRKFAILGVCNLKKRSENLPFWAFLDLYYYWLLCGLRSERNLPTSMPQEICFWKSPGIWNPLIRKKIF